MIASDPIAIHLVKNLLVKSLLVTSFGYGFWLRLLVTAFGYGFW